MLFGYLDPGSGSMILQAILGGVAGAAVAVKLFGRRVLNAIRPQRKSGADPPVESESERG